MLQVFVDTMVTKRGWIGSPYVLVAIDSYSKRVAFQQMGNVTSASAARAFEIILNRWPFEVQSVFSDNGSEVDLCFAFI